MDIEPSFISNPVKSGIYESAALRSLVGSFTTKGRAAGRCVLRGVLRRRFRERGTCRIAAPTTELAAGGDRHD